MSVILNATAQDSIIILLFLLFLIVHDVQHGNRVLRVAVDFKRITYLIGNWEAWMMICVT